MGDSGRKKRSSKQRTTSKQNTARSRHRSRARRRRARQRQYILVGVLALLAVVLVVVTGVLAVRRVRKRKEASSSSAAQTQTPHPSSSSSQGEDGDVMDMPFTTEDKTVVETNPEGIKPTATAELTPQREGSAAAVHVNGIDAFALYEYDEATGMRVKTARHESAWTRGEDIVSLEAFAADTENIVLAAGGGRAWYETWRAYWQQATGSEHCRIGYTVSFDLKNGEHVNAVLLKPGDELAYRPYLENYLYDDAANADAGWYSHLEPDDLSDSMLLTSIKFTPGERFEEIDNRITVTGFVYDAQEDFDYDGNYIGDVRFTTEIVNR